MPDPIADRARAVVDEWLPHECRDDQPWLGIRHDYRDLADRIAAALRAERAAEREMWASWAMSRIGATRPEGYEFNAGWNHAMDTIAAALRARGEAGG